MWLHWLIRGCSVLLFIFAIYVYDLQYATMQGAVMQTGIHSVLIGGKLNDSLNALDMLSASNAKGEGFSVFGLLKRSVNSGIRGISPWLNDIVKDVVYQLEFKEKYKVHPKVLDNSLFLAVLVGRDVNEVKLLLDNGANVYIYYQQNTVLDIAYQMVEILDAEQRRIENANDMEERSKELMLENVKKTKNNYVKIIALLITYRAMKYSEYSDAFREQVQKYLKYRHSEGIEENVPEFVRNYRKKVNDFHSKREMNN